MQDRKCHNVKYNYILRKPKKFNSIINEFRKVANFLFKVCYCILTINYITVYTYLQWYTLNTLFSCVSVSNKTLMASIKEV